MTRNNYDTVLKRTVLKEVKKQYGLFRLVDIARVLKRNVSSVLYQLKRLIQEGSLLRIGKKFVLKSQMKFQTVFDSVRNVLLEIPRLIRKVKNGNRLAYWQWFRLTDHFTKLGKDINQVI